METCTACNGHGFLVKRERYEQAIDYSTYPFTIRAVEVAGIWGPPTDEEAEQDCVDLEPRECRKCGGFGVRFTGKRHGTNRQGTSSHVHL